MAEAKPIPTHFTFGTKLSKYLEGPLEDFAEHKHIDGALQYCILTWTGISYSVNQLHHIIGNVNDILVISLFVSHLMSS